MLQALHDTIIVKPTYEETRSDIIIPQSAKQFKQYHGEVRGLVVSVGPEYPYRKDLKPGDVVTFQRHEGFTFQYQGEKYLKVREKWIHGKVN
jgi:co-chaperonin GroES (HSP10)